MGCVTVPIEGSLGAGCGCGEELVALRAEVAALRSQVARLAAAVGDAPGR
jgi:hypothetical protein